MKLVNMRFIMIIIFVKGFIINTQLDDWETENIVGNHP